MAEVTRPAENPFLDPMSSPTAAAAVANNASFTADSTLVVGKDASLTLATDSLIVLDENYETGGLSSCFGVLTPGPGKTRSIPFYNILWAELSDSELTIHYAQSHSKHVVRPSVLTYSLESLDRIKASTWVQNLLDRSYGESQRRKRAYVLVNPVSGQGKAEKYWQDDIKPLLVAARCTIDVVKTKYSKQAIDLVANLNLDAYDMIVACSGDGLPYEIFNGLGKRADARKALEKVAVVQMPCGSGNAMSLNLTGTSSPSLAALAYIKAVRMPVDLVSITQGDTRTLSFLSQTFGLVADADLGTEHLRWMGGARFNVGLLTRIWNQKAYPCEIAIKVAIDDKAAVKEHYRSEVKKREGIAERRSNKHLSDEDDASASSSGVGEGLPPLKYGTINDKLPDEWEVIHHDTLGIFYCGKMAWMAADTNFFQAALPTDGLMDLVITDSRVSPPKALGIMMSVEQEKLFDKPLVSYRKIHAFRITPKNQHNSLISIDGERVPPQPFQAEVHRGLGTVLSKNGYIFEANGPH